MSVTRIPPPFIQHFIENPLSHQCLTIINSISGICFTWPHILSALTNPLFRYFDLIKPSIISSLSFVFLFIIFPAEIIYSFFAVGAVTMSAPPLG